MAKKILIISLLLVLSITYSAEANGISVSIDGNYRSFNPEPKIINGSTLVPMRGFFEALGAEVRWDVTTRTVTGVRGNTSVVLPIGSTTALVNGQPKALSIPAQIIESSTYIPLRFVGEALGEAVAWQSDTRTIIVGKNNNVNASTAYRNAPGNVVNRSIAATDNQWIYYSNWRDEGKLYRIRTDGSAKTKLNDIPSNEIRIHGDWIYYNHAVFQGKRNMYGSLDYYRMRKDGTGNRKITEWSALYPNIIGDSIYYASGYSVFQSDLDGSNRKTILDFEVRNLYIEQDWIYYLSGINASSIYRVKPDGSSQQRLTDERTFNFIVSDGWIYYNLTVKENGTDSRYFYKIRIDGTQKSLLTNSFISAFNVYEGHIYFSDGTSLYKMKTDGSQKQLLSNHPARSINIVGDWVYYYYSGWDQIYRVKSDGSSRELVQ